MELKETYTRIAIREATGPISQYLLNKSAFLNLAEIWDGGPMEGHLLVQKHGGDYVLYEIIHHFYAGNETVFKHKLEADSIDGFADEIKKWCKIRYRGTMSFDFSILSENKEVRQFFGF